MYISTINYIGQSTTSLDADGTSSIGAEAQIAPYTGQVIRFSEDGQCRYDLNQTVSIGMLALCGVRCQSIGGVGVVMTLLLGGIGVHVENMSIAETSQKDIYPHNVKTFTPVLADQLNIEVTGTGSGNANFWMQRVWAGNLIQFDEVQSANFNIIDPSAIEKSSKGSLFVLQKKMYREVSLGGMRVEDNLFAAGTSEINDYESVFEAIARVGTVQEVVVSAVGPQEAFHGHISASPSGIKSAALQHIFNINVREF